MSLGGNFALVTQRMTFDRAGLNAGEFENLTVEVGVYLDRAFIRRVEEKLGLNTTQQLTDLVALKWSGVSSTHLYLRPGTTCPSISACLSVGSFLLVFFFSFVLLLLLFFLTT